MPNNDVKALGKSLSQVDLCAQDGADITGDARVADFVREFVAFLRKNNNGRRMWSVLAMDVDRHDKFDKLMRYDVRIGVLLKRWKRLESQGFHLTQYFAARSRYVMHAGTVPVNFCEWDVQTTLFNVLIEEFFMGVFWFFPILVPYVRVWFALFEFQLKLISYGPLALIAGFPAFMMHLAPFSIGYVYPQFRYLNPIYQVVIQIFLHLCFNVYMQGMCLFWTPGSIKASFPVITPANNCFLDSILMVGREILTKRFGSRHAALEPAHLRLALANYCYHFDPDYDALVQACGMRRADELGLYLMNRGYFDDQSISMFENMFHVGISVLDYATGVRVRNPHPDYAPLVVVLDTEREHFGWRDEDVPHEQPTPAKVRLKKHVNSLRRHVRDCVLTLSEGHRETFHQVWTSFKRVRTHWLSDGLLRDLAIALVTYMATVKRDEWSGLANGVAMAARVAIFCSLPSVHKLCEKAFGKLSEDGLWFLKIDDMALKDAAWPRMLRAVQRLLRFDKSVVGSKLIALLSLGFFKHVFGTTFGLSRVLERYIGAMEPINSVSEVLERLLDLVTVIFRAVQERDPMLLLCVDSPQTWSARTMIDITKSYYPSTVSGEPRNKHEWLLRMQEHMADADVIGVDMNPVASRVKLQLLDRTKQLEMEVSGYDDKVMPVCGILTGPPGLGKSSFVRALAALFLARVHPGAFVDAGEVTQKARENFVKSSTLCIQAGSSNKYATNMDTSIKVVVLDDAHNLNTRDPTAPMFNNYMIEYVNKLTTLANVAEVDKKGIAFIKNELFLVTSNTSSLMVAPGSQGLGRRVTCELSFALNPSLDASLKGKDIYAWDPISLRDPTVKCSEVSDLSRDEFEEWFPWEYHPSQRVWFSIWTETKDATPQGVFVVTGTVNVLAGTTDRNKFLEEAADILARTYETNRANFEQLRKPLCQFGHYHDPCTCVKAQSMTVAFMAVYLLYLTAYKKDKLARVLLALWAELTGGMVDALTSRLKGKFYSLYEKVMMDFRAFAKMFWTSVKEYSGLIALVMGGGYLYSLQKETVGVPAQGGVVSFQRDALQQNTETRARELFSGFKGILMPAEYSLPHVPFGVQEEGTPSTLEDVMRSVLAATKVISVRGKRVYGMLLDRSASCARYMFPAHVLPEKFEGELLEIRDGLHTDIAPLVQVSMNRENVTVDSRNDIAYVIGGWSLTGKPVRRWLQGSATSLVNVRAATVGANVSVYPLKGPCLQVDAYGRAVALDASVAWSYSRIGNDGDCGLPILAVLAGKPALVGWHVASTATEGVLRVLCASALPPPLAGYDLVLAQSGASMLATMVLGPLDRQSVVNQVLAPIGIIGSAKTGGAKQRSKLVRTCIHDLFPESDEWAPPYFGRGCYLTEASPYVNECGGPNQFVSPTTFKMASLESFGACDGALTRGVAQDLLSTWPCLQRCPLTDEGALRGLGCDPYRDFKMTTSSGPPYSYAGLTPKGKIIDLENLEVDDLFEGWYLKTERELRQGPMILETRWVYKDELRKKAKHYRPRVFSIVSAHLNALLRKYMLPLIEMMMVDVHVTECCPGVNATSRQWHEMASRLRTKDQFMMGDMKNFDSSHSEWMFDAIADFLGVWSSNMGYAKHESDIVRNLTRSCLLQLVEYRGDVFFTNVGLASGLAVTTFFNCLASVFLFRAAFAVLCPGMRYSDHVCSYFYGDDSVNGVSREAGKTFNQQTVQKLLLRWGYRYTSARKDGKLEEFERFEDLAFLKRSFRFSLEIGAYVAPLAEESMYKALGWRMTDKKVGDKERLAQVAYVLWREAYLHEVVWRNAFRERIKYACEREHIVVSFCSDEELKNEYDLGSFIGWYG